MTGNAKPDYAKAIAVDFDTIPIIDLTDIQAPQGFATIADEMMAAAQQSGFFYITNHGIDQVVIENAFAASQAFFRLPQTDKATIRVNQQQRGWMAQGMTNLEGAKTHDAKEVFFWGWDVAANDPDVVAGLPMVAPNQWPNDVAPDLKSDLLEYYSQVVALSQLVLSALAVGLGQKADFFETAYDKPLARGQLVYYPTSTQQDEKEQRFGAATHSDFGVLTMLLQDMQGGLQVQNLAGDWIEAPPIKGSIVCNIGDLLERWTNNRLVSTKHRVLNKSGSDRYSIPIFCDPASQTIIDPRDFGISDADALFEPIAAGAYIASKNTRNFSQYKK
jgi:isopenicillin N synthase-like dioxygenase